MKVNKNNENIDDENKIIGYFDGIILFEGTPEELEGRVKKADEESKNLTEWPRM